MQAISCPRMNRQWTDNTRKEVKTTVRWFVCQVGNLHVTGPCPDCYASQGGLLGGTLLTKDRGRVTTKCANCGKTVDYYVDSLEEKSWRLEPVELTRVSTDDGKGELVGCAEAAASEVLAPLAYSHR